MSVLRGSCFVAALATPAWSRLILSKKQVSASVEHTVPTKLKVALDTTVVKCRKTLLWPFSPSLSSESQTAALSNDFSLLPPQSVKSIKHRPRAGSWHHPTGFLRVLSFQTFHFHLDLAVRKMTLQGCKTGQLSSLMSSTPVCLLFVWQILTKRSKAIFHAFQNPRPNLSFHSPNLARSMNVPGLHSAGLNMELVHHTL